MNEHPSRRKFLKIAAATGAAVAMPAARAQAAAASSPAMIGDALVYADGPNAKKPVKAADLKEGVAVLAMVADPKTKAARDPVNSSVVLVKLKPAEIKDSSKKNAAGSVVAYSSICTHQGCPAQQIGSLGQGKGNVICTCHGSIYDPRDNATVLGGPAPRRLAALPLKLDVSGQLLAAGTFTSKVGPGK